MNLAIAHGNDGLHQDVIDRYHEDGAIHVRGLFKPEEVLVWKAEVERIFALPGLLDPLNVRVEGRRHAQHRTVPDRLDPVLDLSPVFASLVKDPRVCAIAAALIGDSVEILRCKLIRKSPGTAGYGMHQDYPYWEFMGVPANAILTVGVCIDEASEVSGGMEFFRGLHDKKQSADPNDPRDVDPAKIDASLSVRPNASAGDLIFFHSLIPHRSSPNLSEHNRALLLPTFSGKSYGALYKPYHQEYLSRKLKGHKLDTAVLNPFGQQEVAA
jgi:2-aminoethylphosphonate dioxygenase